MDTALGISDRAVQSGQDFVHLLMPLGPDHHTGDAWVIPLHSRVHGFLRVRDIGVRIVRVQP